MQYIMTADGLQRVSAMGKYEDRPEQPERRERPEKKEKPEPSEKTEPSQKPAAPATGGYRYKTPGEKQKADTPVPKSTTMASRQRPSVYLLLSSFFS